MKIDASIIVPIFNCKNQLPKLIQNIARSSNEHEIELILCDDGSSDDPIQVIDSFNDTINIIYRKQEDLGFRPGAARNMGIRSATGSILIFLDQDSIIPIRHLTNHLEAHKNNPNSLFFGFRNRVKLTNDGSRTTYSKIDWDHRIDIVKSCDSMRMTLDNPWYYVYACNYSVTRENAVHLFDESFIGWGLEDTELAYRAFKSGITIRCLPTSFIWEPNSSPPLDPFYLSDRSLPHDFKTYVINTARFINKHKEDESLIRLLKKDLVNLSLESGSIFRCQNVDNSCALITWANQQLLCAT